MTQDVHTLLSVFMQVIMEDYTHIILICSLQSTIRRILYSINFMTYMHSNHTIWQEICQNFNNESGASNIFPDVSCSTVIIMMCECMYMHLCY